ncbi:hypothetical protein P3T76_012949 [Phytophthora citrophthora]|uniref:Uncharacterized protein n=1 Tax=Phytophthora citrophthora TaxID=4793 RepID=A0AAD9G4Q0_9STRA|nr:hypothetical protein P3T76_012949 [Phytophthora citrophthora]
MRAYSEVVSLYTGQRMLERSQKPKPSVELKLPSLWEAAIEKLTVRQRRSKVRDPRALALWGEV